MLRLTSCLAVLVVFAGAAAEASQTVYLAGKKDGFSVPIDSAFPSADLVRTYGQPFQDFDTAAGVNGGAEDTMVGHTFTDLPSDIVDATIELRVKSGVNPFVSNDGLLFSFVDDETTKFLDDLVYARTFGQFAGGGNVFPVPDSGLLTTGTWSTGDDKVFSLDLAALPLAGGGTLDLLPMLNEHGFIDVLVGDETGADYMHLTVTTIPEPSTFILLTMGAVGLLAYGWRRRK